MISKENIIKKVKNTNIYGLSVVANSRGEPLTPLAYIWSTAAAHRGPGAENFADIPTTIQIKELIEEGEMFVDNYVHVDEVLPGKMLYTRAVRHKDGNSLTHPILSTTFPV